jgi:hypothetical protein
MYIQDFTIVLNKFDTGRKRLSSGIRNLYSRGLVATKLTVRASPHFTLKACPLHVGYDTEGRFVWFSDMMLADSHIQSRAIVLTCLGFTWLFRL